MQDENVLRAIKEARYSSELPVDARRGTKKTVKGTALRNLRSWGQVFRLQRHPQIARSQKETINGKTKGKKKDGRGGSQGETAPREERQSDKQQREKKRDGKALGAQGGSGKQNGYVIGASDERYGWDGGASSMGI